MIINEIKTDGKVDKIIICQNDNGKYQHVNLTKGKICQCEFDSHFAAFVDLMIYNLGCKIKALSFDLSDKFKGLE